MHVTANARVLTKSQSHLRYTFTFVTDAVDEKARAFAPGNFYPANVFLSASKAKCQYYKHLP
jgi:hypothetical protein